MKPHWCSDELLQWAESVWTDIANEGLTRDLRTGIIARALLEAEQRGRKAGLEEAAKVCERDVAIGGMFAAAIRAKANEVKP